MSVFGYASYLIGPPAIGFIGEHSGILAALWLVPAALGVALLSTPALGSRPVLAATSGS